MAKRLSYTPETVERAFDIHKTHGLIKDWGKSEGRWFVVNASGDVFELRSLREAYVFVNGLGSASNAVVAGDARLTGARGMEMSERSRFELSMTEKGATTETFFRVVNGHRYEFYRQVNVSGFRVVWVFKDDAPVPVKQFMGVPE